MDDARREALERWDMAREEYLYPYDRAGRMRNAGNELARLLREDAAGRGEEPEGATGSIADRVAAGAELLREWAAGRGEERPADEPATVGTDAGDGVVQAPSPAPAVPSLLPCPFCGGEADDDGEWVYCVKCGVGYERPDAILQWNRRVSVPSLADDPRAVECVVRIEGPLTLSADVGEERRAGLKWLNDALERGDGAFVFSVTEDGDVGVFRAGGDERTPALGVGETAADALDDAAFRAAESARSTGGRHHE